jgi:hypothetical protein
MSSNSSSTISRTPIAVERRTGSSQVSDHIPVRMKNAANTAKSAMNWIGERYSSRSETGKWKVDPDNVSK